MEEQRSEEREVDEKEKREDVQEKGEEDLEELDVFRRTDFWLIFSR